MTPCPTITVYRATDLTPEGFQFIAYFTPAKTIKPKDGEPYQSIELLPVYFRASTEEAARLKASEWWAAEQEKIASKEAAIDKLRARRRAA